MELDQWIQQGIEAWQHGRRSEALATYERIIQRRPTMAIGYRNLAFLQWQNGDARGAIQTLERAFHADAIEPGMTTQLGSYLAEAGRPADAIALLEPLASQKPADPDALNALGHRVCARRAGGSMRSAAFHRALDENPSNVQALENIGTLEMQRGNCPGAKLALRTGGRARSALGPRAQRPRRRRDARRAPRTRRSPHWKRAVELAPNDFDALFNLGMELDAAGRHDEARPFLDRFVRGRAARAVLDRHRQGEEVARAMTVKKAARPDGSNPKVTKAGRPQRSLRDLCDLRDLRD